MTMKRMFALLLALSLLLGAWDLLDKQASK